ncbi:MAG: ATPase, T2SS/T4P/T4SS family [Candidatus Zixiibacteriota bacterium]
MKKTGIFKILSNRGYLKDKDYEMLNSEEHEDPIKDLVRLGYDKDAIIDHLVFATKVQYISPEKVTADLALSKTIPERLVRKHKFIAEYGDEHSITIAMDDPTDFSAAQELEFMTGKKIKTHFTDLNRIQNLIDEVYNPMKTIAMLNEEKYGDLEDDDILIQAGDLSTDLEQISESPDIIEKPIVQLVNTIFIDAINHHASDIHIEPLDSHVEIRYRIDGELMKVQSLPKATIAPIVSRIKILAKMDIAITRVPLDGSLRVKRRDEVLEMRVSTLPTNYGQKAVIRILDPTMTRLPLEALGFPKDIETQLKEVLSLQQGMLIVTGPTGSGKTTTLHASLNWIKTPKKNITTIEDPIEYQQEGLNQVQVNRKAGLDFAKTLRAILRQDPDIVFVGEIRDLETVQIAIRAALTGHLLLTTLHTNSAPAAITRIEDIGVPRYLIASSMTAALAQRLMKKICPACKAEVDIATLTDAEKEFLRRQGVNKIFEGKGCDACGGRGYNGRTGIFEFFKVDADVTELINRGASELELLKFAVERKGMRTLFMDAVKKLREGVTTIDQVAEVVSLHDPLEKARKTAASISNPIPRRNNPQTQNSSLQTTDTENNAFHGMQNPEISIDRNLVLVVDDDPLIRKMVRSILEAQGFKILQAENGEDGLDLLEQYKPGLVILDIRMPIMNGFEFLKRFRSMEQYQGIPVIMLTAEVEESRELFALDVGADDYIRKPFNPTIFLARVNAMIRRFKSD